MSLLFPTAWLLAQLLLPVPVVADVFTYVGPDGSQHFSDLPAIDSRLRLYLTGNGSRARRSAASARHDDPERYTRYDPWIRQAASIYRVPEALVRAVIRAESDFEATAVSPVGARGLMQLMPDTAARMQVPDVDNPRDNILGGVRVLHLLGKEFGARVDLILAAYNAGDAAVIRFGGVPPFPETRQYISHVRRYYARYCALADRVKASRDGPD